MKHASDEDRARERFFLRALDEVDGEDLLLGQRAWDRIRRRVRAQKPEGDHALLDALHQAALQDIERRHEPLSPHWWRSNTGALSLALLALSLCLGISANYLGRGGSVNLLLNPFVLLLVWNILIYLMLVVMSLKQRRWALESNLADAFLRRLSIWFISLPFWGGKGEPPVRRLLIQARIRLTLLLHQWRPGLTRAHASALIHGMAAVFAVGVILGLYLRGLGESYHFVWPSTLIAEGDGDTRRRLLEILFWPALPLFQSMGGALPAFEGDNGAPWIHFFAFAGSVTVVLPRMLLSLTNLAFARSRRAVAFPINQGWFAGQLSELRTRAANLSICSYSYTLKEPTKLALLKLARGVWGGGLQARQETAVDWGSEDLPPLPDSDAVIVLVFNGAQTPEDEVQGVFADHLREAAQEKGFPLLILVDGSSVAADRSDHRRESWLAVLRHRALWVNLDSGPGQAVLEEALRLVQEPSA